jgi:hypothetical protein
MRDHLTYATLAGHRRCRRYVLAAALILIFLGLLFGWSGWQRVRGWTENLESESAPRKEAIWLKGISEPEKSTPTAAIVSCPTDPESWTLLDVVPGENYKRIEPDCVYAGLSKSVAWHMLVRFGYAKREAAERLRFEALPWQPTRSIKGLTHTKGPMNIPFDMEWAPHSEYRTWKVDSDGYPALAYSLRGCYRTRTIVGNDVDLWGSTPVVCVVACDQGPGWTVSELGEQRFSVDLTAAPVQRRFAFFGYAGETWVLLGEASAWQKSIEEPSTAGQEREEVTARYGTVPWDAAWLHVNFGLEMRPLPDGWQTFGTDPEVIQAIANQLDQALGNLGGSP